MQMNWQGRWSITCHITSKHLQMEKKVEQNMNSWDHWEPPEPMYEDQTHYLGLNGLPRSVPFLSKFLSLTSSLNILSAHHTSELGLASAFARQYKSQCWLCLSVTCEVLSALLFVFNITVLPLQKKKDRYIKFLASESKSYASVWRQWRKSTFILKVLLMSLIMIDTSLQKHVT